MCEEMTSLAAEIRASQSDLQGNDRSLSEAMKGLSDYAQNPTKHEVFETTFDALNEALNVAEQKQHELITKAITIAQKVCALNSNAQLSPAAQYCMSLYHCFLDIISPFVYPFKFSRNQLDRMHSEMPAKMKKFCSMLLTNNLGLHLRHILKAGTCTY